MYDFQARMAEGRDQAKRNRDRGNSSAFEVFANDRQRFAGMSDDDWHARCADDEAFANEVEARVDAPAPVPQPRKENRAMTKQPISGGRSMTEKTYVRLLDKLDLTPYGAGSALGISPRMSMRYAAGTHPIPDTIAKLLRALVELGRTDV